VARLAQKAPLRAATPADQLTTRFFSSGVRYLFVLFNFLVDRAILFNDEIKPRPVSSTEEISPRSIEPVAAPAPREIAAKGTIEQNGITEADRLLAAIVLVARKEQTLATKGALRNLIAKFSCEYGLDF
jgi:hypothetical protein